MGIVYPKNVIKIANILAERGYRAYAVGGCIRDSLMGKLPSDWDMTTDASPEKMIEIFDSVGVRTIPTGLKHGTVTVLIDGEQYECTTFRIDGNYTDSRHPDRVIFTQKLAEDLKRRDFTVNAMAADPLLQGEDGEITDLFGGREDIKSKVIRCVGEPRTRFTEDALRILRAVRFATVLDFQICAETKKAAQELGARLENVSAERKKTELEKILLSDRANSGVSLLCEMGLSKHIHPNIKTPTISISSLSMRFAPRLAALFVGGDMPDLSCLKLSRAESSEVSLLCAQDMFKPQKTPQNARYLLSIYGESAADAAILREQAELAEIVREEADKNPCVQIRDLCISGNHLIAQGIEPRSIGKIMSALLREVIERPESNREDILMCLAKDIYSKDI